MHNRTANYLSISYRETRNRNKRVLRSDHLDGEIVYVSVEITREISAYKYRSKNIRRDKIYLRTAMHVQRSIVIIRALVYTHRYLAPKSLCAKQQVLLVEPLRHR